MKEFQQIFLKGAWEDGMWVDFCLYGQGKSSHLASAFADILLTLGSSKFTHPLVSQSQKVKISWLNRRMDHRWQRFKKIICNMFLFKGKTNCTLLILFEPSVLWNILLSLFSLITVENVRQVGHAESLSKLPVFLLRPAVVHRPWAQANRSRRTWFEPQKLDLRGKPWEMRLWRGGSGGRPTLEIRVLTLALGLTILIIYSSVKLLASHLLPEPPKIGLIMFSTFV